MKAASLSLVLSVLSFAAFAAEPAARASVDVDPDLVIGAVKPMNAVNNGPSLKTANGGQKRGNFREYKALRTPFARTHDSINCLFGMPHCCDISAIFPDFDADETVPENYDFTFTDHYLDNIVRAGTKVFFRLGQTIEHGPKKYGVLPPKDFAKWARICEHVIRHYNEGWGWNTDKAPTTQSVAWSNQFNVVYWEIWNEPDLNEDRDEYKRCPQTWGGTREEFFRFYETAAKHLKAKFPDIRIGGPALAFKREWGESFLAYCRTHEVPLDFCSWHFYARTPQRFAERARQMREIMERQGYGDLESILNEWNYVKGWTDDWVYSLSVESGSRRLKGASFISAVMSACQDAPVDMLMFYDARLGTPMNNLFDSCTYWPITGYYSLYAWSKLVDCGTQVKAVVRESSGEASEANSGYVERKDVSAPGQFFAVAARSATGGGAVLVTRYSDDDNVSDTATVTVRVKGADLSRARCHLTDAARTYTEIPLEPDGEGGYTLLMQPLSFAVIEY